MGPGGRLGLLPLVREHIEAVELDLLDRGIDIKDWYRREISTRRFLLIVDDLSRTSSRFWCEVLDRDPLTDDQGLLADIFYSLTNSPHPIRTRREDMKKAKVRAESKARIMRRNKRRKKYSG